MSIFRHTGCDALTVKPQEGLTKGLDVSGMLPQENMSNDSRESDNLVIITSTDACSNEHPPQQAKLGKGELGGSTFLDVETGAVRNKDSSNNEINKNFRRWIFNSSPNARIEKSRGILLLVVTLLATITFRIQFQINRQDSTMVRYLTFLNSMVFIVSVGTTLFLLQEFPLKPLPQITMLSLFASYMFAIRDVSPDDAQTLFFVSIALLLVALVCRHFKSCVKSSPSII